MKVALLCLLLAVGSTYIVGVSALDAPDSLTGNLTEPLNKIIGRKIWNLNDAECEACLTKLPEIIKIIMKLTGEFLELDEVSPLTGNFKKDVKGLVVKLEKDCVCELTSAVGDIVTQLRDANTNGAAKQLVNQLGGTLGLKNSVSAVGDTTRLAGLKNSVSAVGDTTRLAINEAKLFGFLLQGIICLYNEARNGPLDKKAAAYQKIMPYVVGFVNTYASSRDASPNDVFLEQKDRILFLELKTLAMAGDFDDVVLVEITSGGLMLGLGKAMVSNMESLGMSPADSLSSVTGLLGGTTIAAGNLPGGATNSAGNVQYSLIRIFGGLMEAPARG